MERCQLAYGEPCAIIAADTSVVPPDANGHWPPHENARVRYSGSFDLAQIPGMRANAIGRPDVSGYLAATGPKAIAIHAQGILSVATGAASQMAAEEQALKKCNDDPARRKAPGPCLLYASANQVVLPLRRSRPLKQ